MQARGGAYSPHPCGSRIADTGSRWYVVQTHRGCETLAADELGKQGFPTLLPLRRNLAEPRPPDAPRRHRKAAPPPPFRIAFPGYLFVMFDKDRDQWRPVTNTPGVKRLFSSAENSPTPIPVGVVEAIQASLSREALALVPASGAADMPKGTICTVLHGPFAGQEAIVVDGQPDKYGAIKIHLLATGWPVELVSNWVTTE